MVPFALQKSALERNERMKTFPLTLDSGHGESKQKGRMQMKKTRCLKMLALVLVCGGNLAVGAVIANFSNDWNATSGPGQSWSCQWANWDQNSPATFQDLVWDDVTGRMIKADQPDHYIYATAFSAQPNLKLVLGWQAPEAGTVSFIGAGSNWVTQSIYQIIDKGGTVLTSSTVNNSSAGSVSVENVSMAAGDQIYFGYRPNSGSSYSWFEGWPIKIEATFTPDPVPEPMTMGLLAMGGLLILRRRK
jgi:hypothetical protein